MKAMTVVLERAVSWLDGVLGTSGRVESINQLPPAPDGQTYRYEVAVRLSSSTDSPPDEPTIRTLADQILAEMRKIDHPDWEGADELYIQIYAPERATDAGACGTAHWLAAGGYESVEARPYLF